MRMDCRRWVVNDENGLPSMGPRSSMGRRWMLLASFRGNNYFSSSVNHAESGTPHSKVGTSMRMEERSPQTVIGQIVMMMKEVR